MIADDDRDRDLKSWLVELSKTDRETYLAIRSFMWAMFAAGHRRSPKAVRA